MSWAAQCGVGCFRTKANNQFLIKVLKFYLGYISDEALGKAGKWMVQSTPGSVSSVLDLVSAGQDGAGRKLKSRAVHNHLGREERPQTGIKGCAPVRLFHSQIV